MIEIEKEKILEYMKEAGQPLALRDLARGLDYDAEDLEEALIEMEMKGRVILTRRAKYGLPEHMNLMAGRLQRHQKGFGFLIPDVPNQPDIYIKADDMNNALNNDRVMIRLYKQIVPGKRMEGKIIRILERVNNKIVGTYEDGGGYGFVIPDDQRLGTDLFISKNNARGARQGMKVVAEILDWPEKRRNPEAVIIEVLGKKGDPGIDIISIVRKHDLPEDFDPEIRDFVAAQDYSIKKSDLEGRTDLRDMPMVTIDGEDAKDLDDAVSLTVTSKGTYQLGVHIADVGHYVKEGSLLDKEALKRGTSVYLVDRVIPMLPRELSNGICSLNAHEDRLSMSCLMEFDNSGKLLDYEIVESIIHVDKRMTYTNVNRVLSGKDEEALEEFSTYVEMFRQMNDLRKILFQKRKVRGAIDFDFPESKVIVDEMGKPIDIKRRERGEAESLIEEFMLAANETVAAHYHNLEVPFVYRIHEEPTLEKIVDLSGFLAVFGYYLKGITNKLYPKAFQETLDKVKGSKQERIISTMMLRSMRHARYSTDALGHFGLAAEYYSHFTSPIRRYPDLAIHRVIKEMIHNGNRLSAKRSKALLDRLEDYAERSSVRELVAEEAERESVDMKKVEYMLSYVGEEFDGVVNGVTPFGLFIELHNLVEGLVHISTMDDDYYIFDEKMLALLGERTRRNFTIGDPVRVKIVRANVETRQIDMELV